MRDDQHWIVSWEIDAHQPTAHEAAQHVRATVLPADSTATVFTVADPETGERWSIDLGDGSVQLLPAQVLVTMADIASSCAGIDEECGMDAILRVGDTITCPEHMAPVAFRALERPQEVTVTKYDGTSLCAVAEGHENTRAEYRAGRWLVCYRHLARGVAASVHGYGRP